MGFPEQLKKARLNMNYTQQEVANLMGITKSTYCGYETGKRQPDIAKIKRLAAILNTSVDIFLETGYDSTKPNDSKADEVLSLFLSLRPDFQDYALDQIKKLAELQNNSKK